MNYEKILGYAARYGGKAMGGDPTAMTIAAVLGVCAIGVYAFESFTKKIADD